MNRQMPKKEPLSWSTNDEGKNRIVSRYKKTRGIPDGEDPMEMIGTLIRGEMIPAILDHEYPKN
jgi:hypothetical protein